MLANVDTSSMQLFVQRTTRHGPYPAQCSLLLKDKVGEPFLLYNYPRRKVYFIELDLLL